MAPQVTATIVDDDPQDYESQHVHAVYDEIAPHFSSTRYKPWPIIAKFIADLPTGWVGLDSGTGNGKYLPLPLERPTDIWTIGLDRSRNLLKIAQTAGGVQREVVWGDVLDKPWRDGAFDYAISIATIHHLATHERRMAAVQRLVRAVNPAHGRILIYVWAIEQDDLSKRSIPQSEATRARGEDVFVPWVMSKELQSKSGAKNAASPEHSHTTSQAIDPPQVFNRYYHMFARGELTDLVRGAAKGLSIHLGSPEDGVMEGIEIVQDGWERSNYYVELRRWRK
ncbi:S-adenosyl-L-methionine-dependent methyltransferase [Phanerochaete sordida]|uniref:S-adenosyl-L-methionine-dependent methyltransferase n=1 Tax=Phanerochaete sordida TaxID=48140 RepID=A0A9P3G289_9APHY|nr:S-adenosyl-L-methionine-dependent methyltransferase [Phanerochaete sordida]